MKLPLLIGAILGIMILLCLTLFAVEERAKDEAIRSLIDAVHMGVGYIEIDGVRFNRAP